MGSGSSLPLPDLPSNDVFCVSFRRMDTINILYAGLQELEIIRQAIHGYYPKGIQEEKTKVDEKSGKSHRVSFKLHGNPFTYTSDNHVEVRRMAAKILLDLHNIGWKLLISTDVMRLMDNSTWIFKRESLIPFQEPLLSIGLGQSDKIQISDCPPHLINKIRELIEKIWVHPIQEEKQIDAFSYKFKLSGTPWCYVNKKESCSARHLLREMITMLSNNQYTLYGNTNLKGTSDTFFFKFNPEKPVFQEFVTISINRTDRMRLIHVPDRLITTIDDLVRINWDQGVQEVKDNRPELYEIKFSGRPFACYDDQSTKTRKLINKIFEKMASLGYCIRTGIDMTRKINDKSLLLFQLGEPITTKFFCLALKGMDRLQVIDAPQDIIQSARNVIMHWPMGVKEEKVLFDAISTEVKLNGVPWHSGYNKDNFQGKSLLMALLTNFTSLGWKLMCSADVSAMICHRDKAPDFPIDSHSWYFMYDPSIVPNAPLQLPPSYDAAMSS